LGISVDTKERKKKEDYVNLIAKTITTNPSLIEPAVPKDGM
jgi:hypothetical protein